MNSARQLTRLKIVCLVMVVVALVCLPFVIFGQEYAIPWLESYEQQSGALILIAVILLAADSLAPVPSTLVIMFLAAKVGPVLGILGSTLGLTLGVVTSAWLGRTAVGRLAPRFIPNAELVRLRENLQKRLPLTMACWRAVPVMSETSVILAAAAGVPMRRIFAATLLPNILVAIIYSMAADDSFGTACVTFISTLAASALLWRLVTRPVKVERGTRSAE